jgi:hypothetical protein
MVGDLARASIDLHAGRSQRGCPPSPSPSTSPPPPRCAPAGAEIEDARIAAGVLGHLQCHVPITCVDYSSERVQVHTGAQAAAPTGRRRCSDCGLMSVCRHDLQLQPAPLGSQKPNGQRWMPARTPRVLPARPPARPPGPPAGLHNANIASFLEHPRPRWARVRWINCNATSGDVLTVSRRSAAAPRPAHSCKCQWQRQPRKAPPAHGSAQGPCPTWRLGVGLLAPADPGGVLRSTPVGCGGRRPPAAHQV